MRTVKVLSDVTNFNVVHSEGRRYPGLVVQGDTLVGWLEMARAATPDDMELLVEELETALAEYNRVCSAHGLRYEPQPP